MRTAVLLALAGCRGILGIDDVGVVMPPSPDATGIADAAVDGPLDASIGCPFGYQTLPSSGPRNHRYKVIPSLASWSAQRSACATQGGFLAFPDGPDASSELTALIAAGGPGVWLGVDDITSEGSYRTSLNLPASTSTLALIALSGNPNGTDCLAGTTTTMDDEDCSILSKAVCECVP